MSLILGCIADDFTGATDLANTLVSQGMAVRQVIGVPDNASVIGDAEAVVVALKSRTNPPHEAVTQSVEAASWLRDRGARQFLFKYCSTFDSTDEGNIGPVGDSLLQLLCADFTIACPAFPANARTVYKGHLFVGDQLLSDSGMKNHPLTPMKDSDLVRVLGRQTSRKVGLVSMEIVTKGPQAIADAYSDLRSKGYQYAIVDALTDSDLQSIGAASDDLIFITGGSGIALGLPENFRRAGLLEKCRSPALPTVKGRQAIISGSCSIATQAQVAYIKNIWPFFKINSQEILEGQNILLKVSNWLEKQSPEKPILIYSTTSPDEIQSIQSEFGRQESGLIVERTLGEIALRLFDCNVRQLIVAGGETSGAVVQALGIKALKIGPEIEPGVPWTETIGPSPLALALKSGNFGGDDFFEKAFLMLERGQQE